MKRKYSVFLDHVGTFSDRYVAAYSPRPFTIAEKIERIRSIPLLSAMDLCLTPEMIAEKDELRRCVKESGLKVASVCMDTTADPVFKQGSFSSLDAGVRAKTMEDAKAAVDLAAEMGSNIMTIWPGQDGFDYLFQADYIKERTYFEEAVSQLCDYNPNVNITLEYKPKEPRCRCYVNTIGTTLLMCEHIGKKNLGVAMDYGHAFFAYENPADSVAMCKMYGNRLMHIHMNDNHGLWDDDMIAGSVHTLHYLEFIYWLRRTGYQGYITFDQFPYRENSRDAVEESAKWFDFLEGLIDTAPAEEIEACLQKKDGVAASRLMRSLLQK